MFLNQRLDDRFLSNVTEPETILLFHHWNGLWLSDIGDFFIFCFLGFFFSPCFVFTHLHFFEKQILRFVLLGSMPIKLSVLRVSLGDALQVPEVRQLWHLYADGFREWEALQTEMTNEMHFTIQAEAYVKN